MLGLTHREPEKPHAFLRYFQPGKKFARLAAKRSLILKSPERRNASGFCREVRKADLEREGPPFEFVPGEAPHEMGGNV